MTCEELPANWPQLPLSDPDLASGVLDLIVPESARMAGALCLALCDDEDRMLHPITVDLSGHPSPRSTAELCVLFAPFATALHEAQPEGSALVAIARADGLSVTAEDLLWQQAAMQAFPRLLGVHLVTGHGSRELPPLPSAA